MFQILLDRAPCVLCGRFFALLGQSTSTGSYPRSKKSHNLRIPTEWSTEVLSLTSRSCNPQIWKALARTNELEFLKYAPHSIPILGEVGVNRRLSLIPSSFLPIQNHHSITQFPNFRWRLKIKTQYVMGNVVTKCCVVTNKCYQKR